MKSRIAQAAVLTATAGMAFAGSAGVAAADSGSKGFTTGSPGIGSGNGLQAPLDAPVNACGLTVSLAGAVNPAFGNTCLQVDRG